jgi:hypothetical protein
VQTRIVVLLGLLLLGFEGRADAQGGVLFGGGGATFSGPDVSQTNGQAMVAGLLNFSPHIGARLDGLYTFADGDDLAGFNGDGVVSFGRAGARLSPYLLGGGGVFFSGGVAKASVNGGLGLRTAITQRTGVFIESRYFRFFDVSSDFDDMIFVTAGLSFTIP